MMMTHDGAAWDQLLARLADLEHANARLQEEMVALKATGPDSGPEGNRRTSRRTVLHVAAKAAVAGGAGLVGVGIVGTRPARASTVDTDFTATGPAAVGYQTTSGAGFSTGADVAGDLIGVHGTANTPGFPGVGGAFEGPNRAPLHLEGVMVSQPPSTGQCGDLYVTMNVDNFCTLWFHAGIGGWIKVTP